MTLEEIRASDKATLLPTDVAPVLGVNAHSLRIQAASGPELLGFPVIRVGTRTLIPRLPFLAYIEGGGA